MIHHFSTVDSTNIVAAGMAARGAPHGTVVYADRQTGGRGRAGRDFLSPVGGLYFSLIIKSELAPADLPLIPLAAGVGLCRGIKSVVAVNVQLKWPNDLYLNDRKLGGILTESGPIRSGSRPDFLIVGVGMNVRTAADQFPSSLRSRVISLYHGEENGAGVDVLLKSCVDGLLSSVHRLAGDREKVLAAWRALDYLQGRNLAYDSESGVISATGIGLAPDGCYVVRDRSGVEHRILAGDVNPSGLACR